MGVKLVFSHLQSIHYRWEVIKDAGVAVQSSVEVLHGLESLNESLRQSHRICPQGAPPILLSDERLRLCVSRFGIVHRRVEDVLDRAKQASTLVGNLEGFRLRRCSFRGV